MGEKGVGMSSIEGLRNEIISLERRLREAEQMGDEAKIRYCEERIRRLEIEIGNQERMKRIRCG